ncbi:MAG: sugar phosphate nucleotidyltransferase [Caldimicrobium sp.]
MACQDIEGGLLLGNRNMKIKAFILAAGFGTRLRPLTYLIPKPLLPILGKPLLYYLLKKLSCSEIAEIGMNLHYLSEKIETWLKESPFENKVSLFYEKEILGTGGGLKNAEAFLRDTPFLVHNGDVWTTFDLRELLNFHRERKPLATLLVIDNPAINTLYVEKKGNLLGVKGLMEVSNYAKRVTFAGIALYEARFLQYLEKGYSSLVSAWIKAINNGEEISTLEINNPWFDLGTFSSYFRAVKYFLKMRGEKVFFHPEADTEELNWDGYVSVESKTLFKKGSFLKNVLVYAPEKIVKEIYEGGILVEDHFIPISEAKEATFEDINLGGSEKKFIRTKEGFVLMKAGPNYEDLKRSYEYNVFLRDKGVGVPTIKEINLEKGEILFEDLGDVSLYTWLKGKRDLKKIEEKYKEVLEEMIKLHTIKMEDCSKFYIFDFGHFRWESTYFEEKFLNYLCGIKGDVYLRREFDELAKLCDSFSKNLIHRDFQSQNVMLKRGKPYLIDYQGARIGPPGYDLASLLWDPYYKLVEKIRTELIDYYILTRKERDKLFNEIELLESLPYLRVQRHMQALGAYVNLSFFKGKKHFLKFIPQALEYLWEEVNGFSFTSLRKVLEVAMEKIKEWEINETFEEICE